MKNTKSPGEPAEVLKYKPLRYSEIETQIKFLQGKILTLVEASFSDVEQRNSFKSMVNSIFSNQLNWIHDLCTDLRARSFNEDQIIDVGAPNHADEVEVLTPGI